MTGNEKTPPDHWADLTEKERRAILELARGRVFWHDLWARMGWLKGAGTVMLTLAAAMTLMRDWVGEILQWFMLPK